jgi:hypothetical protein
MRLDRHAACASDLGHRTSDIGLRYHLRMRYVLGLVLVVALVAGGAFFYAGRLPGPTIEIAKPTKYVGQTGALEVAITAPGAKLSGLEIAFEQNGKQTPLV